jgi:hypothetical protein
VLYDLEPAGVVTVRFAEHEDAQKCIEVCYMLCLPSAPLDVSVNPLSFEAFNGCLRNLSLV